MGTRSLSSCTEGSSCVRQCRLLGVSRLGYYGDRQRAKRVLNA